MPRFNESMRLQYALVIILAVGLCQANQLKHSNDSDLVNEDEYYDDSDQEEQMNDLEMQRKQSQSLQRQPPPQAAQYPPQFYTPLMQPQPMPANSPVAPSRFMNLFNQPANGGRASWVQPHGNGVPVNPNIGTGQKFVMMPVGNAAGDPKTLPTGSLVSRPSVQQPVIQQPQKSQIPASTSRIVDPNVGRPKEPTQWDMNHQSYGVYPSNMAGQKVVVVPSANSNGRGPAPSTASQIPSQPRQPQIFYPQQPQQNIQNPQMQPFYPQQQMVGPGDRSSIRIMPPQKPSPQVPPTQAAIPSPPQQQIQPMQIVRPQNMNSQPSHPHPVIGQNPAIPQNPVPLPQISNQPLGKPQLPAIVSVSNIEPNAVKPQPAPPPAESPAESKHTGRPVDVHTKHGKVLLEPYIENYCDARQFTDDVLASRHLQRVEYFVANLTCSRYFFECAIGQTFLLDCTSKDQVFDINTVNCNFKYNVKTCTEYDHILHCSIREECQADQFACCTPPQQCIPYLKRCDGVVDCADGEDENNCPSCDAEEFPCVKSGKCISWEKRCNGIPDECFDQTNLDEHNCGGCPADKFACNRPSEAYAMPICIDLNLRCNGIRECPRGEDELNCKSKGHKYLLCENQKQSVSKDQWCDGYEDCLDGSDEKYCVY